MRQHNAPQRLPHGDVGGLRGAADRVGEIQEVDVVGIGVSGEVERRFAFPGGVVLAGIMQGEEGVQQRP